MHVSSHLALGYMNCEATVDECLEFKAKGYTVHIIIIGQMMDHGHLRKSL